MAADETTAPLSSSLPPTPIEDHRVPFTGACTIAEAETIRNRLMEDLQASAGRRLVIDCDEISEVDLTFIQLLLATRRSGEALGYPVVLSRPASGVLADALVSAGFAHPDATPSGWLNPFWAGA